MCENATNIKILLRFLTDYPSKRLPCVVDTQRECGKGCCNLSSTDSKFICVLTADKKGEAVSVAAASFGTKFCKGLANIRVALVFHGALIERNISEGSLMIRP